MSRYNDENDDDYGQFDEYGVPIGDSDDDEEEDSSRGFLSRSSTSSGGSRVSGAGLPASRPPLERPSSSGSVPSPIRSPDARPGGLNAPSSGSSFASRPPSGGGASSGGMSRTGSGSSSSSPFGSSGLGSGLSRQTGPQPYTPAGSGRDESSSRFPATPRTSGEAPKLGERRDAPKEPPKTGKDKDEKESGGGLRTRIGGFLGRGKDGDKDARKDAGKKPDAKSGGLMSKMPSGRDDHPAGKPAGAKANQGGGVVARIGGLLGRGKGDKGGKSTDKKPDLSRSTGGYPSPSSSTSRTTGSYSAPSSYSTSSSGARGSTQSKSGQKSGGLRERFARLFSPRKDSKARPAPRTGKTVEVRQLSLSMDKKLELLGVAMTIVGGILLLSSLSPTPGTIPDEINRWLSKQLGIGAVFVPIAMLPLGIWLIMLRVGQETPVVDLQRVIGLIALYAGLLALFQFADALNYPPGINQTYEEYLAALQNVLLPLSAEFGRGGGRVGSEIYYFLISNFGEIAGFVILVGWLFVAVLFTFSVSVQEIVAFVISLFRSFRDARQRRAQRRAALLAERQALSANAAPITITKTGGQAADQPALPGQPALLEAGRSEERAIPIHMGGRTTLAPFRPGETVPVESESAEHDNAPASKPSASAVPKPGSQEQNASAKGGLFGKLRSAVPFVGGAAAAAAVGAAKSAVEAAARPTDDKSATAGKPAPEDKGADETRASRLGKLNPFAGRRSGGTKTEETNGKPAAAKKPAQTSQAGKAASTEQPTAESKPNSVSPSGVRPFASSSRSPLTPPKRLVDNGEDDPDDDREPDDAPPKRLGDLLRQSSASASTSTPPARSTGDSPATQTEKDSHTSTGSVTGRFAPPAAPALSPKPSAAPSVRKADTAASAAPDKEKEAEKSPLTPRTARPASAPGQQPAAPLTPPERKASPDEPAKLAPPAAGTKPPLVKPTLTPPAGKETPAAPKSETSSITPPVRPAPKPTASPKRADPADDDPFADDLDELDDAPDARLRSAVRSTVSGTITPRPAAPSPLSSTGLSSGSTSAASVEPQREADETKAAENEIPEDWTKLPPAQPKNPLRTTNTIPAAADEVKAPSAQKPAVSPPPQQAEHKVPAAQGIPDLQTRLNALRAGKPIGAPSAAKADEQPTQTAPTEKTPDKPAGGDQVSEKLAPASAQQAQVTSRASVPPAASRPAAGSGAAPSSAQPPAMSKPETPSSTVPAARPPAQSPAQPPAASSTPAAAPSSPTGRTRKEWKMPDIAALLEAGADHELNHDQLLVRARVIEDTLSSFGAPGRVVEVRTGPVVTQFGVEPDYIEVRGGKKNRVKVSAIAALDKDLQLALGAKSIRIEAPVPGKGYVGIEVPNDKPSIVRLRDVMESPEFRRIRSPLAIALGQGVDGTPVAADLASMPHLLIAGTTGSGKSVCVNTIIASLLLRNSPDRLKFIMVDPKRVELTGYNGIPHLVAPVVVELERTVSVLKWVTREMDDRYHKFSRAGARNIEDYNRHLPTGEPVMPYIVVIIDELADLMMMAPDETERVITRIAAMARATGIHLVIATQRPSVDVVTGLIKANFPARIAFAVAGGVDSRVILDQPGAERLLGRGDMLYMSGDAPAPQRLQGVFVSDAEINAITRFWRSQLEDAELAARSRPILTSFALDEAAKERENGKTNGGGLGARSFGSSASSRLFDDDDDALEGDDDELTDDGEDVLYNDAVELVRRLNKASVSLLQRRLRIGYTRAARLIDMMEERGVVGPPVEGSRPREVLPPKL